MAFEVADGDAASDALVAIEKLLVLLESGVV